MKKSRNDGPWRVAVLKKRGAYCRACGATRLPTLEIDHLVPRSQGGKSDVENGLVLCGPWGCDAHGRKTRHELQIPRDWLDADQVEYLAEQGWVRWTEEGLEGRGLGNFAPTNVDTDP